MLNNYGTKTEFTELLRKNSGVRTEFAANFIQWLADMREISFTENIIYSEFDYFDLFMGNWEQFFNSKYNTKYYNELKLVI